METQTRLDIIKHVLDDNDEPDYRFEQIKYAIYQKGITDLENISTLSKKLRTDLSTKLNLVGSSDFLSLKKLVELKGKQVQKLLFETQTHNKLESVRMTYMPNSKREQELYSLCVSSQSGCALGCRFCATGSIGLRQNLSSDEITDQILYFRQQQQKVDNIIFMGMGEPFSNADNVFSALRTLIDPSLFALSPRRISISTVGIVPGIHRLTKEFPNVNLAFSLHTPFQNQREELMPIAKIYPINKVFEAVDNYVQKTNNKVFISYILLENFTDSLEHAAALAKLLKTKKPRTYLYHVNLIRYNPGKSKTIFKRPSTVRVKEFQSVLDKNNISNTLRQDFGVEINAACGQLYGSY